MADSTQKQITVVWNDKDLPKPTLACILIEKDDHGISVQSDGNVLFIPYGSFRLFYAKIGS